MNWKNYPTWVKGGIIAEIILIIGYLLLPSQGLSVMIIFFFGENPYGFLMVLWFIALYFVIGAGIGWIIQKIKK